MKPLHWICMVGVLFSLVEAQEVIAPEPAPPRFPRIEVTPRNPGVGDSAVVWLVKGVHSNSCVPTYRTSYTVTREPIEIYPPVYTVEVSYEESWPDPGSICGMVMTEYGPRFTLEELKLGTYRVVDGGSIVGSFSVTESHSISGTVTDDPRPSRRMPKPLEKVKVYLMRMEQMYTVDDPEASTALYPVPYGTIDSAVTDAEGRYGFSGYGDGQYRLSFVAAGYRGRVVNLALSTDTTIDVQLVPEDAAGAVSGTVSTVKCPSNPLMGMPCVLEPLPGCTVTVYPADCGLIAPGPVPLAKGAADLVPLCPGYTAVTDEQGAYMIEDIALSYNEYPVTVTARKAGYVTATTSATLSNTMTTRVDFQLESAYVNSASDTVDGVVFTVATERRHYRAGELLRVRYTVYNGSMATVTYHFTSTCQFDMELTDDGGEVLYRYMDGRGCGDALTTIELGPGEAESFTFPSYTIGGGVDTLTAAAHMIGYDRSRVSVNVGVGGATSAAAAPVGVKRDGPALGWSARRNVLTVTLDREGTVGLDVFRLDGRRIAKLSGRRLLKRGANTIGFPKDGLSGGVFVVRATGPDFALIRTISVGR